MLGKPTGSSSNRNPKLIIMNTGIKEKDKNLANDHLVANMFDQKIFGRLLREFKMHNL